MPPATPRLRHRMDYHPGSQNPRPPHSVRRVEPINRRVLVLNSRPRDTTLDWQLSIVAAYRFVETAPCGRESQVMIASAMKVNPIPSTMPK